MNACDSSSYQRTPLIRTELLGRRDFPIRGATYLVMVYVQIKTFSIITPFSNAGVKAVFLSLILIIFDFKLFYCEEIVFG